MTPEERLQLALERIFSDPALTNSLRDSEATVLLNWAQKQVRCLTEETVGLDDEAAWVWLNPRLRTLRRTIHRIAKHSGSADDPMTAVHRHISRLPKHQEETEHDEI